MTYMTYKKVHRAVKIFEQLSSIDRQLGTNPTTHSLQIMVQTPGGTQSYMHLDQDVKQAAFNMQVRALQYKRAALIRELAQLGVDPDITK